MTSGDLFERYPSPPDEIVGIAAGLLQTSETFTLTTTDVQRGMDRAVDAVDGDLSFPMQDAPRAVVQAGTDLALSARFASGALMLFAQAVTAFNDGVDGLNRRWRASDPGGDAISPARLALLGRLRGEHAALEQALDDAALRTSGMLGRGTQ